MSKKIDGGNPDSHPSDEPLKHTIPELLRSISHKFRSAIRQQKEESNHTPSEMHSKNVEHFKE